MLARHRVVILGGGFGGLYATRRLRAAPVEVTLVDRHNYHLFQPLLYQVATGSLSPGEIAAPLRGILSRQRNSRVLLGEVQDIDPVAKRVFLAGGEACAYDSLIVAVGSQGNYFGHADWQRWAPDLKSVEEATEVRHKIFYAFEAAERFCAPPAACPWLTFAIVGAGPTGLELAGALAEIARDTLRHDFRAIRPEDARIVLLEGSPRVLPTYPADLSVKAERALRRLGVQVRTGVHVVEVDGDGVTLQAEGRTERLPAKTVLWAGGVRLVPFGRTLARRTGAETDRTGRLKVEPDLTLRPYPDIYVVGDLALAMGADGQPLPGLAPVAMQEGAYAAKAIRRRVEGEAPPPPFRYMDKGTMAVIGRGAAVADIFGFHVSGFPAWLLWLFVHLMYLVQFQSRVLVFIQWGFQYLTFSRGARLITGSTPSDLTARRPAAAPAADAPAQMKRTA
ncbi:MAG TPA: NAD(P)/FAD-dependent oxidoreductase [Candidatus Sulfotelmatobacter sp.]|nr:NAD(P)/FAD-dependent oxidoreductase [Candidatus Sulfotelmatobacter sp.]